VAALAFYGMSTFEGPLMSIRAVNGLSHYTDWTIGHVHSGALGWVGMISFSSMYFLAPRVFGVARLYSLRMINWHFWMAMGGITLYTASMWVAGIMQGLMWREFNAEGYLVYAFAEVVAAMHPYYAIRFLGGVLYLMGALVMVYNVWMTARGRVRTEAPLDAGHPYNPHADRPLAPSAQPQPAE
jgi:cytochrome c oxidase cbb3-type subunit 1